MGFYGWDRVEILVQDGQSSKKAGLGNVEVFEMDTIQKREMIDRLMDECMCV